MELATGETLGARLQRQGRLGATEVERILRALLDGLEKVHAANFIHRDIKPDNILLDDEGQPTLIDFGAARAAVAGRTSALTGIFTPGYAAVEQFADGRQGPFTDIYALSATLYQSITGEKP
jgi:serine/threonine protein kinase